MKGIVFTEFLEMVESTFGLEVVDAIIESSELKSEGAYTSVGTYDFNEMVQLLTNLSSVANTSTNNLLFSFGHYLFGGLIKTHPEVISSYKNPIGLLNSIEDHIHIHVKKLYPDAELPSFKVLERTDSTLVMVYNSSRGLYALAHGLMEKTFEHFNKQVTIDVEVLNEAGTEVKFVIEQNG